MARRARWSRLGALLGSAVVLALGATSPAVAGASDAEPAAAGQAGAAATRALVAAYVPERVISAPSFPAVAAWGLAYNPVTDEMIVGDYVSRQVRRYTRDGVYLGDLQNGRQTVGGVASALGVDPRDGAIYLAVTGEGRTSLDVRKYDKYGQFMFDLDMPKATTWLTVDKDGNLWVPEGFSGSVVRKFSVDDATASATLLLTITSAAPGETMGVLTGAATDGEGNIYVSDVGRKVVHSWTPEGVWRFNLGPTPNQGDLRGVAVDNELQRIYLSDAVFGGIRAFDFAGNYVSSFSRLGMAEGEFTDGARQVAVTPDHHIWGADYGSFRVQEFLPDGTFVKSFPDPKMPADPAGISQARGLDIDPVTGDAVVVDAWGQKIMRFASDGTLLQSYGRRGSTPPEGLNYPKAVAVDPVTRNVWVSSYEGPPGVVGYDASFAGSIGRLDIPRWVGDLEFSGGYLYALERRPGAVRVIDPTTLKVVRTWKSTVGLLHGIAVDPATGNMWITHDTKAMAYVVSRAGKIIKQFALPGVGWGVAMRGDEVAIANTTTSRIDVFNRKTYQKTASIGLGKGVLFGQMKTPSGLAFDPAGRLYVLEQGNSRVTVFGPGPRPAPETAPPTLTLSGDAPVVGGQLVLTGSASDVSGIATLEATVQDLTTGRFLDERYATWLPTQAWSAGLLWGPIDAPSWRFTVPRTLPGRSYAVQVRTTDRRGNVSLVTATSVDVP